MKTFKALAAIAFFFILDGVSAQSVTDRWPAMKAFHDVMSRSFHPTEEGNFAVLKDNSATLMNKAMDLTKQEIPHEFQTKAIMSSVQRLQEKTKEVNALVVSKATDAQLNKAIVEAHDIFHEIVGLCSAEKPHKH